MSIRTGASTSEHSTCGPSGRPSGGGGPSLCHLVFPPPLHPRFGRCAGRPETPRSGFGDGVAALGHQWFATTEDDVQKCAGIGNVRVLSSNWPAWMGCQPAAAVSSRVRRPHCLRSRRVPSGDGWWLSARSHVSCSWLLAPCGPVTGEGRRCCVGAVRSGCWCCWAVPSCGGASPGECALLFTRCCTSRATRGGNSSNGGIKRSSVFSVRNLAENGSRNGPSGSI